LKFFAFLYRGFIFTRPTIIREDKSSVVIRICLFCDCLYL